MNRHPQSDIVWNALRNKDCTACGLYEQAQSVCLLGDGPVPCDAMIIGEGPGKREDDIEIPFSGKSGVLLRKTLKEIGIDPRQVFITNVVACRPPGNRTPTSGEAKTCSSLYLVKQIEMVKPKVILCLGNVAVKFALGKKAAVTKIEGTTFRYKATSFLKDGIICVPSRHPSAVARIEDIDAHAYAQALQQFKENLLLFKRTLNPIADTFEYYSGFPELKDGPVYTDIETDGLNPFRSDAKIWCNSIIQSHKERPWTYVLEGNRQFQKQTREMLENHPIMAHRTTFEGTWYLEHFGVSPRIYFDTKVCAYVMDENDDSGLKYQCIRYLGVDPWSEEMDFQDPDMKKLLPYNARDDKYGIQLYYRIQLPFLRRNPKIAKLLKYIVFPAIEVFIEAICHGFHIDMKAADKKLEECIAHMERLNGYLNEFAGKPVNPGSPKQMNALFYNKVEEGGLGLKCPKIAQTPKGNDSTSEAARIRLKGQHPAVEILDEWHKWQKFEGTYLVPWMRKGPILHANYGFTDTDTGRLNSTMVKNKRYEKKLGATLHQCPRDAFIRNLITARGYHEYHPPKPENIHPEEWGVAAGDLSQVELRLVADAANEPTMTEIFHKDPGTSEGDIHFQTARELVNLIEEITKELRKRAKAVNFGFVYGMFEDKFVRYALEKFDLKLTKQEGRDYREKFFGKYDRLQPWHRRVEGLVSSRGYIDSWFGRRRRLPSAKYGSGVEEWIRREAVRQGINSPIQGTASDITLLIAALIASQSLSWKFKIDKTKAFVIGSAHDSLLFEYHKSYARELKEGLLWTVSKLPQVTEKYFGFRFKVPILMEVALYDDCWEGKEYDSNTRT